MHCIEVWTQDSDYASTVHMFLASLPHGLREVWIECATSSQPWRYTDLVVGDQDTKNFEKLGWSAYFDPQLSRSLHGLRRCLFPLMYVLTRAALDIVW